MKDTNNILPYNLWSGSDYENTITYASKTGSFEAIPSNEYCDIGEQSYKITSAEHNDYMRLYEQSNLSIGDEITFSTTILNVSNGVVIVRISDTENPVDIDVSPSSIPQRVSVSKTLTTTVCRAIIYFRGSGDCYLDNNTLIKN